jgi:hypothetical protein
MKLASRIFLFTYAAAMAVVAAALYLHHGSETDSFWLETGLTSLAYSLFAFGYATFPDRERAPSRVWMVLAFLALAFVPSSFLVMFFQGKPLFAYGLLGTMIFTLSVLLYLAIALLLLHHFRAQAVGYHVRRIVAPIILVAGAALVFSSLRLHITDNSHCGWDVLLRKAEWITVHVNVGTPILFGSPIDWLQPFYAHGGYPIYLLALLATVTTLIALAAGRLSVDRFRTSSLGALSAVVINLVSLWVLNDIFWGWHFDLSTIPWAAAVATALWLLGPIAGAILLIPLLWKRHETWRLHAFLLLQVPIAAFNVMQFPAYFESDLDLPGIGILIIGLQLESWACLDLLSYRGKDLEPAQKMTSQEELAVK